MKHILKSCRLLAIPVLVAGLLFAGCDLLDVDNPNNLVEEDLSNPAAAIAMANGAEASVTRAIGPDSEKSQLQPPMNCTGLDLGMRSSSSIWETQPTRLMSSPTALFPLWPKLAGW